MWTRVTAERGLLAWLAAALLLALLPYGVAACCRPPTLSGLGSVWFVNDHAQYESAVRQGAERPDWLIEDRFTAEPHAPTFMFPLYVGTGKAAAWLSLPPESLERLLEVLTRAIFVVALWRFLRAFASRPAALHLGMAVALLGGGLGWLVALADALLPLDRLYTGNFSYELNTLGLLYAAPHVPLGMAATLELAGWLRRDRARAIRPRQALGAALLGAALALLHPFHVPVVLGALGIAGLVWSRGGQGHGTLLAAIAAALGALPALLPTALTFTLDPFWSATYSRQNVLPSPAPHELLVDLGLVLVLALLGTRFLSPGATPFGPLLWLLLAALAMYLPVPYQRRFAFGVHPALALLAAETLLALRAAWHGQRALAPLASVVAPALLFAGSGVLLASIVVSPLTNAPLGIYRSTPDLDAAAGWLDRQARPGEVILAEWDVANYLAPRTPARAFGGHPVATLRPEEKRFAIATYFAHADLEVARRLGAHWVVHTPPRPGSEPTRLPPQPPAFAAGEVRVYRVGR